MIKFHLPVYTLVEGQTLIVDDQSVWTTPIHELAENMNIVVPIHAELTFFPQEEGFLIQGSMKGEVALMCNRCAEEARIYLDVTITSFEPFPVENTDEDEAFEADPDLDVAVFTTIEETLYFDAAMFLWEEFVLALPVKPLCSEKCKGLCTTCGTNLNTKQCACKHDEGDPRLAALRGFVVQRKNS